MFGDMLLLRFLSSAAVHDVYLLHTHTSTVRYKCHHMYIHVLLFLT